MYKRKLRLQAEATERRINDNSRKLNIIGELRDLRGGDNNNDNNNDNK